MAADLAADADLGALGAGVRRRAPLQLRRLRCRPTATWSSTSTTSTRPCPGPWEWDLKRLAASFEIAGRDRGFGDAQRREIVLTAARAYREHMRELAELSNLDVWYQRLDVSQIREAFAPAASKKERKAFERNVAKAQRKDRLRAFSKLTTRVDGELRIVSDPPVLVPLEELFSGKQLKTAQTRHARGDRRRTARPSTASTATSSTSYRYVDAARKVVGVGSVGTRAWIALFVGRDEDDPLFLQVKEAQASVLEPYTAPSEFAHQGQRVVEGQRLTQAASDILLGWLTAVGSGRQEARLLRAPALGPEGLGRWSSAMTPRGMTAYAQICGGILARAHARSGDRIAIAAYLGGGDSFDRAIAEFRRRLRRPERARLRGAAGRGRRWQPWRPRPAAPRSRARSGRRRRRRMRPSPGRSVSPPPR